MSYVAGVRETKFYKSSRPDWLLLDAVLFLRVQKYLYIDIFPCKRFIKISYSWGWACGPVLQKHGGRVTQTPFYIHLFDSIKKVKKTHLSTPSIYLLTCFETVNFLKPRSLLVPRPLRADNGDTSENFI